ncbi:MAG: hypothetical protein Kow0049_20650 [Stanieria sp.]|jgi:hypothetical protein
MKLCYRGVNYKYDTVVFHQQESSSAMKGKYRGLESLITPSLNLSHQDHLQLKYRGVKYIKGWANSSQENSFGPQLQPVTV